MASDRRLTYVDDIMWRKLNQYPVGLTLVGLLTHGPLRTVMFQGMMWLTRSIDDHNSRIVGYSLCSLYLLCTPWHHVPVYGLLMGLAAALRFVPPQPDKRLYKVTTERTRVVALD